MKKITVLFPVFGILLAGCLFIGCTLTTNGQEPAAGGETASGDESGQINMPELFETSESSGTAPPSKKNPESEAVDLSSEMTSSDLTMLEAPPSMKVQYQEETLISHSGSYEWNYPAEGDEMVSVIADGAHPLEVDFSEHSIHLSDTAGTDKMIELSFEVSPDAIKVKCWNGKYRLDMKSSAVTDRSQDLTKKTGYRIAVTEDQINVYEVIATWEGEKYFGSASYCFLAGPQKVLMDIRDVTDSGATVVFQNNTLEEYTTGDYYLIEVKENGTWKELPCLPEINAGFHDIAYVLLPGAVWEQAVNWEWLYGRLDPGEYRIVKRVLEAVDEVHHDKELLQRAEFTIS